MPICPPISAPTEKAPSAVSDAATDRPGAPASAKPRKMTLPVMLATKTWPRAMKLTASTRPVTTVSITRKEGRGPCGPPLQGQNLN